MTNNNKENKRELSAGERAVRGIGGTMLGTIAAGVPTNLGSLYSMNKAIGFNGEFSYGKDTTKADLRKMDRLAKNHGYVRTKVAPNIPDEAIGTWYNPKTGKNIHLSGRQQGLFEGGPHFQPGTGSFDDLMKGSANDPMGTLKKMYAQAGGKDGIIRMGNTRTSRSTPIMAHELGHAMQGKKMLRMNMVGKPLAMLGTVGVLGSNILEAGADPETTDKVQKGFAAAGTLGGLGLAASEAHASWLGSKGLRPKLRLKSFAGLPSYLGLAAAPAAAYYANKKWRNMVAPEKTASVIGDGNYVLVPKSQTLAMLDSCSEKIATRTGKVNADVAKYLEDKTPLDMGDHIEKAETIARKIHVPNPNSSKSATNETYKAINKLRKSGDA